MFSYKAITCCAKEFFFNCFNNNVNNALSAKLVLAEKLLRFINNSHEFWNFIIFFLFFASLGKNINYKQFVLIRGQFLAFQSNITLINTC